MTILIAIIAILYYYLFMSAESPNYLPDQIGLVAFSFALRENEPNPCNQRLGSAVSRIVSLETVPVAVVAQWEIASALEGTNVEVLHTVDLAGDGSYLDSAAVWDQAKGHFAAKSITKIIPVAQPFIHLPFVKKMIRSDGFEIIKRDVGRIGFDNSELNTQQWTRSRSAFVIQAIKLQLLGKEHGHGGRQSA